MSSGDVNAIMVAYLKTQPVATLVGNRIFCPRLPENTTLPALALFVRGGSSTPYIPPVVEPSFQIDLWGSSPIVARSVYMALYEALQGIQNVKVTIAPTDYYIKSAIEEVQGQDVQDIDYPNYCRVIAFFRVMIQIQ